MKNTKGYISIGSNLGDRLRYCQRAIDLLRATSGLKLTAISSAFLTEPVGYLNQPDFINLAVELQCELSACGLYQRCKVIEKELGRVSEVRWGPRVVDLDLLMLGTEVIDLPDLIVPHPRMHERRFVLEPLAEIAPGLVHPVLHRTAEQMLSMLEGVGGRSKERIFWIDEQIGFTSRAREWTKTA